MSELALLGGAPVLSEPLPPYRSIGEPEMEAVAEVMESGCLSAFYGSPVPEFLGGPKVRAFEAAWAERFGTKHAVSVNSATSGLVAAMGAVGVSPGDEVVVPPWTMSATAMAPLAYGGIPVFVDIEPDTFCLDVGAVKAALTPRTRAIIAVNLFGHPARLAELRELADRRGIWLVEDSAQAPLGEEHGRRCGTVGHIGVFSFNFHKHIHTGEGGMCVTGDDDLARRLQLIRNHGENAAAWLGVRDLVNMIGFNLRMTELSAAIGLAQFHNMEEHVAVRERLATTLTDGVADLDGLTPPRPRFGCRHNYYCWTLRYDADAVGVSRETFSRALHAEGFPHFVAYLEPLYLLPVFQERIALGRDGFPFTLTERRYGKGLCPIAERLHEREAILFEPCAWQVSDADAERLVAAVRKVHARAGELAAWDEERVRTRAVRS